MVVINITVRKDFISYIYILRIKIFKNNLKLLKVLNKYKIWTAAKNPDIPTFLSPVYPLISF